MHSTRILKNKNNKITIASTALCFGLINFDMAWPLYSVHIPNRFTLNVEISYLFINLNDLFFIRHHSVNMLRFDQLLMNSFADLIHDIYFTSINAPFEYQTLLTFMRSIILYR